MSPAAEPAWLDPSIVAGFVAATPNSRLIDYAGRLSRGTPLAALDIGCGAGRNAVPLARSGANVIGTDLSWPMLTAAAARDAAGRLHLARAPMHALPIRSQSMDLIIAHGIWNLARSGAEFRQAVREAARCERSRVSSSRSVSEMAPGSIPASEALRLEDLIKPADHGIASRILAKNGGGSVTLFAFADGEGLSEHTAPFDALVLVLEGALALTIGGQPVQAGPGTIVRLPAGIPHVVDAPAASRMLLIMLREAATA